MRFTTAATVALSVSFAAAAPLKVRQLQEADATVLTFANVLEQLETEFYKQALAKFTDADFTAAGFTSPAVPKQLFTSILEHESEHTDFLGSALAGAAPNNCVFDFGPALDDVATMAAVARVVEQVGVSAYLGASTLISDKSILAAAASILTIEARHQSALNLLNGGSAIPAAFDLALSPQQVLTLAGPFVSGCDLGIPPNPEVKVTNAIAPNAKLEFDLTGLEGEEHFCQMLIPNQPIAISQPVDNCVVPGSLPDGPVYLFISKDPQPLTTNVVVQNAAQIVAGPALVFIDQREDTLSSLVRDAEAARDIVRGGDSPSAPSPGSPEEGSNAPETPENVGGAPETPANAGDAPAGEAPAAKAPITVIGLTKIPKPQ